MAGDEFTGGAHVDYQGTIFQVLTRALYRDEPGAPVKKKGPDDYSGYKDVCPIHGKQLTALGSLLAVRGLIFCGFGNFRDFYEGGVEGGACADVGESLAGEGVHVGASGMELGPVKARCDDTRG